MMSKCAHCGGNVLSSMIPDMPPRCVQCARPAYRVAVSMPAPVVETVRQRRSVTPEYIAREIKVICSTEHCRFPAREGRKLCARCARIGRRRANAFHRRRVKAGLCVMCEKPHDRKAYRCAECTAYSTKQQRIRRQVKQAAAIQQELKNERTG